MNTRRQLLKLATLGGGIVFLSGLGHRAMAAGRPKDDFFFVHLSD